VRAKLKGGKMRYVPMPPELAAEFRSYPAVLGEDQIFPKEPGAKKDRQRVDKSFATILDLAGIQDFRFHDLRHRADSPVMPTSLRLVPYSPLFCAGTASMLAG
jgi:integrase